MQLSNVSLNAVSKTKLRDSFQSPTTNNSSEVDTKFGTVLNEVVNKQNSRNDSIPSTTNSDVDANKLNELIDLESVEDVLDLLGIQNSDGLLMIQNMDNQELRSIDELMNLEDLLSLLNMDQSQLQNLLEQLINSEQINVEQGNIWELIQLVNEHGPTIVDQIITALQGEHKVSPKGAEQLLQLLKLAGAIGKKADLGQDQQIQLANLKDVLKEISTDLKAQQTLLITTSKDTSLAKVANQGFQQVVKQIETTTETQQTISGQQTIVTTPKTITITLPVEKSAQGEALVKEVQQLIGRGQFSNVQGTMKLLLKLYPENLGSIRIEVMQKDGVLTLRLLASTVQAKELLDGQLQQLKTSFAQANIQMDRIDIAQSLQDADRNLRDQNLFGNLFSQQEEEQKNEDEHNDDEEEQMSFQDYLMNEEV
ncbi:hypothetical protein CD29_00220 [Ureibacillus manganicus DSM 26584]|uniref:Flagellar hook-length control protein-like C-terminal domain-containing protein n=2 Tax=Ureibacillus TaxID=160795 RepID=A0A0A3IC22_9BACL|nr:hypothetical protein CD29_00220 [Ureibacillus manganicus DSM 26584]